MAERADWRFSGRHLEALPCLGLDHLCSFCHATSPLCRGFLNYKSVTDNNKTEPFGSFWGKERKPIRSAVDGSLPTPVFVTGQGDGCEEKSAPVTEPRRQL